MFMDRHDAPGVTPEEVARLHNEDEAVQAKYGVRYHTYWFDPSDGAVYCLAEGPSEEAIVAVHREAHGQLAGTVIELDHAVPLNEFFGALPTYPTGTAYSESAMRAIVFTDLVGSVEQTSRLGDDGHLEILRDHDRIVRSELKSYGGREVKHTGDGIMASFASSASSVAFSIAVQRALLDRNRTAETPLDVKIGINAGEPVTGDNSDLFGAVVQLAARLCDHGSAGDIVTSVAVRELCAGKQFEFVDTGPIALKGLPQPTSVYSVSWRDAL